VSCAQAPRDGGIDATAALDHALAGALECTPTETHTELKRAIGQALSDIMDAPQDPAIHAHTGLGQSEETWRDVVRERLATRSRALTP
jgi:hypothetical protein